MTHHRSPLAGLDSNAAAAAASNPAAGTHAELATRPQGAEGPGRRNHHG